MIHEQVKLMEDRLRDLEQEMHQIRSLLVVNFCQYKDKPRNIVHPLWESLDDVKDKSTYKMVIEAIEFAIQLDSE